MIDAQLARTDYLRKLAIALTHARHGQAGPLVRAAMGVLGYSTSQAVYAALQRETGWRSGRKTRSDRGESIVNAEQVEKMAGFLQAATRDNAKRLMTFETAIEVAAENGVIDSRISATTLARRMTEHGLHPSQVSRASAHQEMRSLHPNHVWQLDASMCVLYYLPSGRVASMDATKFNERKPRNLGLVLNERVLRYVATDHASGFIFVRYYNTSGENTETLFEFLLWCFSKHPTRIAHGVPQMMVWDAGAANTSHPIKSLFLALGIQHWAHLPGNSRAKGQVEGAQNIVERSFEGLLRLSNRVACLEDLNARAETWQQAFNGKKEHSRTRAPRAEVWQRITGEQLRLCPPREVCEQLMVTKPETRKVDGALEISFAPKGYGSMRYRVEHVPGVRAGDELLVVVNPYRLPSIWIVSEERGTAARYIECDPVERDAYGFAVDAAVFGQEFKSKPKSDLDRNREDMNEAAYGVREQRDVAATRAKGKVAYDGQFDPFKHLERQASELPTYLPKRGSELNVPLSVSIEQQPLNHVAALKALAALLARPITAEENALVAQLYPAGVPEDEIAALAERLNAPATTTTTRHLRAVS